MTSIGVRELKQKTSAVLAAVRENAEEVEITYRGQVIARIVPVRPATRRRKKRTSAGWQAMDELAREIGTAVDKAGSSAGDWRRDP
jgi:prevent-host-death family protein